MKQALGLVEIAGLSTAIVAADAMAKAANIRILEIENTKGLGYMTIKAVGDVGAVKAAVDVGRQVGIMHQKLVSCKVIPRPSDYVEEFFTDPDDGEKKKAKVCEPEPEHSIESKGEPEKEEQTESRSELRPEAQTAGKSEPKPEDEEADRNEPKPEEAEAGKSEPRSEEPEEIEIEPELSETQPETAEPEEAAQTEPATEGASGTKKAEAASRSSKPPRRKGSAKKKESGQNETG